MADHDPLEDSDLLLELVRALARKPEAVKVFAKEVDGNLQLKIEVDPADRGYIIGKAGSTISAIRTLFAKIGSLDQRRVNVDLTEDESDRRKRPSRKRGNRREQEQQKTGRP